MYSRVLSSLVSIFLLAALLPMAQAMGGERVAVLPLDVSKAPKVRYLGRALAQMLSTRLAGAAQAEVVDPAEVENRMASGEFRDQLSSLASKLRADFLVGGDVTAGGDGAVKVDLYLYPGGVPEPVRHVGFSARRDSDLIAGVEQAAVELAYALASGDRGLAPDSRGGDVVQVQPLLEAPLAVNQDAGPPNRDDEDISSIPDYPEDEEEGARGPGTGLPWPYSQDGGTGDQEGPVPEEKNAQAVARSDDDEGISVIPDYPAGLDEEEGRSTGLPWPFNRPSKKAGKAEDHGPSRAVSEAKTLEVPPGGRLPYPTPEEVFGLARAGAPGQPSSLGSDEAGELVPSNSSQGAEVSSVSKGAQGGKGPVSPAPDAEDGQGPIWQWY